MGASHALVISDIAKTDSGKYFARIGEEAYLITEIVVEGNLGWASCCLETCQPFFVSDAAPDQVRQIEQFRVIEGTTATVTCECASTEAVTWLKDGLEIHSDVHYEIIQEGQKHYLIVHDAQLADTAEYAIRQAGETQPVIQLIVESKILYCIMPEGLPFTTVQKRTTFLEDQSFNFQRLR